MMTAVSPHDLQRGAEGEAGRVRGFEAWQGWKAGRQAGQDQERLAGYEETGCGMDGVG